MKKIIIFSIIVSILFLTACVNNGKNAEDPVELKENELSNSDLSYAFGVSIGGSIQNFTDNLDYDEFLQGVKDVIEGNREPRISPLEVNQKINDTLRARNDRKWEGNLKKGQDFLAENKEKDGVFTTGSGLQYEILQEGDGAKPEADDTVEVKYVGTLIDGTEFDSSGDTPTSFSLNGVIPGWIEGLQLMNVGSKYKFYIPSELGYGARGSQNIEPNEALIFEVELLNITETE